MDRKILQAMGLPAYESAAYLALLEAGKPQSAREISELSKVPPTATYPALKSLIRKGFVQEYSGDLKKFSAIDPKIAIPAYSESRIAKEKEGADSALRAIDAFLSSSSKGRNAGAQSASELIAISTGYETSREITKRLLERSKKTFLISGWGFGKSKNKRDYETLHDLSKLVGRGVDVRFLVGNIEPGHEKKVSEYRKLGIRMRKTNVTNISIVISDGSECKITVGRRAHAERVNIHVKDPDLSKALVEYFGILWKRSTDL